MSQCSKAVANNFTPYGVLHQKGPNVWQNKNNLKYKCKRWKALYATETIFTVTKYIGEHINGEKIVNQDITDSKLLYNRYFEVPEENEKAVIVWRDSKFKKYRFETLGKTEVHKLNSYLLLVDLNLGGSILSKSKDQNLIELTNGLLVEKLKHQKSN